MTEFLEVAARFGGLGGWVLAAACFVALFREFPRWRLSANETRRDAAAERAGDFTRIRDEVDRLDKRVRRLEAENEECHSNLADATRRIAELEGYNLGKGEAREHAQLIVSADRQERAKPPPQGAPLNPLAPARKPRKDKA